MKKSLWFPPQLRTGPNSDTEHRHATWLELFYDLVFVAIIGELAHNLSQDVSLSGFFGFVVLFVPVWWSWVGATFYATRFDCDRDLGHRLLTLLQIAGIAVLAVNAHHGLEEGSAGFALSYTAVRAVTIFEYIRAGRAIPVVRPLTTRYIAGFAIAAGLWFVSAFVPPPWRFVLWGLGIIVDLGTPYLVSGELLKQFPPHLSHIPERIGLFTIIVLGESILGVVRGVSEQQWGTLSATVALLGLSIAFSLWWIYFDSVDGSPLRAVRSGYINLGLIWLYTHLPLVIGLAATGVGVEHVISTEPGVGVSLVERWLICGSVALCLLALAVIHLITCTLGTTRRRKVLVLYRLGAATFVLVLAVAGGNLLPITLMALVAVACVSQVILDLRDATAFA